MKKILSVLFSVMFVLVLFLANVPATVQAKSGDWNTGTEYAVNLDETPAPSGKALLSTGVSISSARTICYPFPKAQYGWSGSIYQMFDGSWYKVTTEVKWTPNTEGKMMACAKVYSAAKYALFGNYVGLPESDDD